MNGILAGAFTSLSFCVDFEDRFERAVGEGVAFSRARAHQVVAEPFTGPADPAYSARRHAGDQGILWDILGDHRASGNHRVVAEVMPAHDRGIGADRDPASDPGGEKLVLALDF